MAGSAQKIVPHLWFDTQAREAVAFYISLFPDSRLIHTRTLHDTPSGDCDVVSFELWGQRFQAINAGPLFTFSPAISFMVNFDPLNFGDAPSPEQAAKQSLEAAWNKLCEGGTVLMPLDEYPFSRCYGWVQDRYGLSWQLILIDPKGEPRPPILPSLLFVSDNHGNAEDASSFYLDVFRNSHRGRLVRYGADQAPDVEGTVMFTDFMLEDCWFTAMDSAHPHGFAFNEAVSFMVNCEDQEEIDDYWAKLSAVPEAEQCGWLKDQYGLSWQIIPARLDDMLRNGTEEQVANVTRAFLQMKKFDLAALEKAYQAS